MKNMEILCRPDTTEDQKRKKVKQMLFYIKSRIYALFVLLLAANTLTLAQPEALLRLPDNIAPKDRICFALYSVHENTLKLTAQFYPIKNFEPFYATLVPDSRQYDGWRITISQLDNFSMTDGYELPTLELSEADQVVTVRTGFTQEISSSLRVNGTRYQPRVLEEGVYTIEVGEGRNSRRLSPVAAKKNNQEVLKVDLD